MVLSCWVEEEWSHNVEPWKHQLMEQFWQDTDWMCGLQDR